MTGKRRSLRLELIATLAIVLMMAAVSLSFATEVLGHRRHLAQEIERIEDHVRAMSIVVAPLLGSGVAGEAQRSEVEQVLRTSIGTLGIQTIEVWRLVDDRAQAVASLGLGPDLPPPNRAADGRAEVQSAAAEGLIVVDRPIRTFGSPRQAPVLVLRMVARPSPWTRGGDWQEMLVLALGIGVVLLVLGGLLLEIQVLRPLAQVREAARRVSMGDLAARAPGDGPAEVQSLAEAFNRMTASLRDKLSEIEAQREQLVRSEQLASVGRIAAGMAHEVGNPLAAILGYVELLLDKRTQPPLSAEQRTMLERTRDQIQRIQRLVGQLLEYSRPAHRELRVVDVPHAVHNLLSLLGHDARLEGVRLDIDASTEVRALADPALLEQVVQNLVVNAARAAHTHGKAPAILVRVFEDPAGEKAILEVQDSGPGVAHEARPNLFQPFFTTAKAGEGTGLGLAISQGLVESMDGSIECLQDGARSPLGPDAGPGAVFRITLPLAPRASGQNVLDPPHV